MRIDARVPAGPLAEKWDHCQQEMRLIAPANRGRFRVLVVGAGLAGASAAATLAEQGFSVTVMTLLDSPRRSHSVAAQGGINAARNYANDGDSIRRMFVDTLKGGDFRAREANVYRLAQLSGRVIDMLVAQGVPFAREYGGGLINRSFGGVQVSRTFYARGQTGQQLLLGVHGSLLRQVRAGQVQLLTRREMVDLVVVRGRAVGVIARNLVNGQFESYAADAVVMASGGYSSVYLLSTNAINSNASAIWRCHRRGAWMANPSFTQFHPTCIPPLNPVQSKLTLMSESLRNDGRIWVPRQKNEDRRPELVPEEDRDYFLERLYPAFGNLVPRDVASRAIRSVVEAGSGVGASGRACYLDFAHSLKRVGEASLQDRYGNLFAMYQEISGDDPRKVPMQISPAPHFTMGGLWVDYHLRTNLGGLFAIGEANCSDHGANRLGANSLLQTMVDGCFVLPRTLAHELACTGPSQIAPDHPQFADCALQCQQQTSDWLARSGTQSAGQIHRRLGDILWREVGVCRSREGLLKALDELQNLAHEFDTQLTVPGHRDSLNAELERAGRVYDFLQLGRLMGLDALRREESCGAHFRQEHQDEQGHPVRNDQDFAHVAVWEWGQEPVLHTESLEFEAVTRVTRQYKQS